MKPFSIVVTYAVPDKGQIPGRPTEWVAGTNRHLDAFIVYGANRDDALTAAAPIIEQERQYGERVKKIVAKAIPVHVASEEMGAPSLFDLDGIARKTDDGEGDAYSEVDK